MDSSAERWPATETLFRSVREYSRTHAVRYGEWPTPVVLVGSDLWDAILREFRMMRRELHGLIVSGRRLFEGVLLLPAPGNKEAEILSARHLAPTEWRMLSDLGVSGTVTAAGLPEGTGPAGPDQAFDVAHLARDFKWAESPVILAYAGETAAHGKADAQDDVDQVLDRVWRAGCDAATSPDFDGEPGAQDTYRRAVIAQAREALARFDLGKS